MCAAVGSSGHVVPGRHTWLLADPESFGEVMANTVAAAAAARPTGSPVPTVVPLEAAAP
jgi:hypothetical protein